MNERPNDRTDNALEEHAGDGDTLMPADATPARALSPEFGSHAPIRALPCAFGNYELLAEIARGGMGIVYKARHRELDRLVALKMILADPDSSTLERFSLEARAAAGLDHPNIVPVYDSGWIEGRPYFTMALVEGENLHQHVKAHGLPAADWAVELLRPLVDAVAHAHARGVVHRDLKPQNVLLGDGRPRVADFGLARRFHEAGGLTSPGQLLGTPQYMAPEQALGDARAISPGVDVYALGGILYFLLTGNPPFSGPLTVTVLRQVIEEPPVPPRAVNSLAPAELEAICLRCLAKSPGDRYPSAKALGEALADWARRADTVIDAPGTNAAGAPSRGQPSGSTLPLPSPGPTVAPRRRLLAGLLAGGVLLAALGVGGAYWANRDKRPETSSGPAEPGPAPGQDQAALLGRGPDLPEGARNDFGLTVELPRSKEGPEGRRLYAEGDKVTFRVTAERTAYVGIWTFDADGTITQLFPNEDEPDNEVRAGQPRVVPGHYKIDATATAPNRADAVWVFASTQKWDAVSGEKAGPFVLFRKGAERDKAMVALRGMAVRRKSTEGARTSVKSLLYVVQPRRSKEGP